MLSCGSCACRPGVKPLTDVASKWAFVVAICSLQGVAHSCRNLLQLKQLVATIYVQWSTLNSLFAMVYLRCYFSFNRNNNPIIAWDIIGALMKIQDEWWKPFENRMKIGWDIKGLQVKYSACWNFCCKPSQAIWTSYRKSIASQLLATSVQGLKHTQLIREIYVYRTHTWGFVRQLGVYHRRGDYRKDTITETLVSGCYWSIVHNWNWDEKMYPWIIHPNF